MFSAMSATAGTTNCLLVFKMDFAKEASRMTPSPQHYADNIGVNVGVVPEPRGHQSSTVEQTRSTRAGDHHEAADERDGLERWTPYWPPLPKAAAYGRSHCNWPVKAVTVATKSTMKIRLAVARTEQP